MFGESGNLTDLAEAGGESWPGLPRKTAELILERVAKRSEADYVNFSKACPGGFITGSCDNGHRYAKEVYCGREWCEVCNGKDDESGEMKPSHARRFARWYDKATQIDSLGYWTFTIPELERAEYRSKEKLAEFGRQVVELLKSFGYDRGLRRWHWFGDKSEKWNPHLNVLVDGGLLNGKALRMIRRAYSELLGVELAIAEYHYLKSPGQKVHALRYVTRATFLDARWDVPMALELRGFRNQLWWGSKRWGGEVVWSLDELPGKPVAGMSDEQAHAIDSLEHGKCPVDGLPITWEGFLPISLLKAQGGHSIEAGYWILPGVSPPPYRLDFSKLAERVTSPGSLKRSLGGSYLPAELVDARLAEFSRQHRRFVANWKWCRDLEAEDLAIAESGGFSPPGQNSSAAKLFRGGVGLSGNLTELPGGSENN